MECPKCKSDEVKQKNCKGDGSCMGWLDHDCPGKPHVRRTCKNGHYVNVELEPEKELPKELEKKQD